MPQLGRQVLQRRRNAVIVLQAADKADHEAGSASAIQFDASRRRGLRGQRGRLIARGGDQIDLESDELGGEAWRTVVMAFREAVFDQSRPVPARR